MCLEPHYLHWLYIWFGLKKVVIIAKISFIIFGFDLATLCIAFFIPTFKLFYYINICHLGMQTAAVNLVTRHPYSVCANVVCMYFMAMIMPSLTDYVLCQCNGRHPEFRKFTMKLMAIVYGLCWWQHQTAIYRITMQSTSTG